MCFESFWTTEIGGFQAVKSQQSDLWDVCVTFLQVTGKIYQANLKLHLLRQTGPNPGLASNSWRHQLSMPTTEFDPTRLIQPSPPLISRSLSTHQPLTWPWCPMSSSAAHRPWSWWNHHQCIAKMFMKNGATIYRYFVCIHIYWDHPGSVNTRPKTAGRTCGFCCGFCCGKIWPFKKPWFCLWFLLRFLLWQNLTF